MNGRHEGFGGRPMRTPLALGLILVLGFGLAADCKDKSAGGAGAGKGALLTARPPGFAVEKPVLGRAAAVAYLPRETLFVAACDGVRKAFERFDRERLQKSFREYYEQALALVTPVVGVNLLDPANLPQVGLDPDGPVGFAWLSVRDETVAFFASLTNVDAFKTTLYRLAGLDRVQLKTEVAGDALIVYPERDSEIVVVLRDKTAILVGGDHDEETLAWARRVAVIQGPDSLAQTADYKAALAGLDYGAAAAAYVNVPQFAEYLRAEFGQRLAAQANSTAAGQLRAVEEAERRVAEARRSGAPADTLAFLEAEAARLRREAGPPSDPWESRYAARKQAEFRMVDALFGSVREFALGLGVEGPALQFQVAAAMAPDGLLARLVKSAQGLPVLVRAMRERPMFLLEGQVDPAVALELFGLALAADGDSLDEAKGEAIQRFGVDIDRDVLPLLTGRLGGAASWRSDRVFHNDDEAAAALGVAFVIGINDVTKAQGVVDRVLGSALLAPLVTRAPDGKRFTVIVPEWKALTVGITADAIVVGTDPSLVDRVARGEAKESFVTTAPNARLKALFATPGPAVVSAIDLGSFAFLFMAGSIPYRELAVREPDAIGTADVPFSARYLAKKSELEAVERQLQEVQRERDEHEFMSARKLAERAGLTAAWLQHDGKRLRIYGGQYFAAESLPALVESVVRDALALDTSGDQFRGQTSALYERIDALRRELQQIREADLEAARQAALQPLVAPPLGGQPLGPQLQPLPRPFPNNPPLDR